MRTRLASLLRRWADRLDPAPDWHIGGWQTEPGFVWGDYSTSGNGAWLDANPWPEP